MGGVLCKKCSNKDDDEKVNEENEFNEEGNTSPRLSMLQENSNKQKSEETFTKSIKLKRRKIEIKEKEEKEEKEEKTEYNKSIRYSKTSKDIDKLKFEENEPPKENNNEKKPRRKSKKDELDCCIKNSYTGSHHECCVQSPRVQFNLHVTILTHYKFYFNK